MADVRVVLDRAELTRLLRTETGEVGRYLVQQAQRVTNGAKARCPVDTGNLRASITWELARQGDELVARIGTNVPYAIYVHEGTRFMAPRPFLRDALNDLTV